MVIEDHVAQQVRLSVESVAKSMRLAKEGNLEEAFKESKMAFISSGKSLFDCTFVYYRVIALIFYLFVE